MVGRILTPELSQLLLTESSPVNEKSSKKKKMDEKVTGFTDGAEKSTSKKVEPK